MKVLDPDAAASPTPASARGRGATARRSPRCSPTSTAAFPGIRFRMIDEQDRIRPHMRIFVNRVQVEDSRHAARAGRRGADPAALSGG